MNAQDIAVAVAANTLPLTIIFAAASFLCSRTWPYVGKVVGLFLGPATAFALWFFAFGYAYWVLKSEADDVHYAAGAGFAMFALIGGIWFLGGIAGVVAAVLMPE
ncbi:MAG: hypothetical protein ABUS48_02675 [Pseudomonadota bacterium]